MFPTQKEFYLENVSFPPSEHSHQLRMHPDILLLGGPTSQNMISGSISSFEGKEIHTCRQTSLGWGNINTFLLSEVNGWIQLAQLKKKTAHIQTVFIICTTLITRSM